MKLKLLRSLLVAGLLAVAFVFGLWVAAPEQEDTQALQNAEVWTCSMHPQIRMPEPGKCPICGMDLIPLEEGDPLHVVISERAKSLARIRSAPVLRAGASAELRLLGRLEYDETRVRTITPWTGGRIDKLFVSNLGATIKAGAPIAAMYSPEVYAAQRDLEGALRQRERLEKALPVAQRAADRAVEASEMRLSLLGVSSRSIKDGKPASRTITIASNYDGTVIEQLVHEGAYVKAGQPLYRIADLSKLWAQLDAYEGDLPRIAVGQRVSLEVASRAGETFEGIIAFIDPIVDPHTRTAQIRVEVDNLEARLSRGMFADAIIQTGSDREAPLLIVRSAPLFTGKRSLVYVEVPGADQPTYEARPVRLGPLSGRYYPVLAGLREGERVVTHGAFTLDSDLQIRSGRSMMSLPDDAERALEQLQIDAAFHKRLADVTEAYLAVQVALAKDDLEGAKLAYADLAERLVGSDPQASNEARRVWRPIGARMHDHAERGASAKTIASARRSFEQVSLPLISALRRFGNPLEAELRMAECPMAIDKRAASWLQRSDSVENPYWGGEMLRCGTLNSEPVGQVQMSESP